MTSICTVIAAAEQQHSTPGFLSVPRTAVQRLPNQDLAPTAASASSRDDAATWWDTHERGTNNRPRPGARLRLVDGRGAVVQSYEGCWPSHQFPAVVDGWPTPRIMTTTDVDAEL